MTIHSMLHKYMDGYISPNPSYGPNFTKKTLGKIQRIYPTKITGLGGHRVLSKEEYFSNQYTFSFVREPYSRLISHLNWQIHQMNIPHSFDSFIDNPYFQNFQTFRLTGTRNFELAKIIVDNSYDFIGIMKYFNASVSVISEALFRDPDHIVFEKMNITSDNNRSIILDQLSSKQMNKLKTNNKTDLDLYEYMLNKFENKYQSQISKGLLERSSITYSNRAILKRKLSNAYIGKFIQPFIEKRVQNGY